MPPCLSKTVLTAGVVHGTINTPIWILGVGMHSNTISSLFSFTTNFMCDLKFKPRNGGLKTLVPFIISLAYIFSFKFIPCYNELKSEHYSHEPGTNRYGPMSYVLLAGPTKIAVSAHGWTGTQKRASRRSGRVPSLPFFLLAPSG
jgi:hypothetical protein